MKRWFGLTAHCAILGASISLLFGGAAAAACTVERLAEMPVTMSGTRPLVQSKINGVDATFLADSGAFHSLISTANALQYGLKLYPAPFGFELHGIGGATDAQLTTVKTFTLLGTDLHNIVFVVGGSEVGNGAVGLIGQNVLRFEDVEFDLAGGAIRLFKTAGCGGANLAYWGAGKPISVITIDPATQQETAIVGSAYVNGVRIRVLFDTGAARSFLSLAAAARAGIKVDSPGVTIGGRSRGVGRRTVASWIATVASFKIGDEEIRNTRLRIGDTNLGEADMLLGADFFLSHRVYVAKHLNRLFFTYNGGPVFNLNQPPSEAETAQAAAGAPPSVAPAAEETPVDADGFSRRGEARAARRDLTGALADLDRACELAPQEPRYFYQRAILRLSNNQPVLAIADLDVTLKLQPDNVRALVARAGLHQARRERAAALADLDAADKVAAKMADERLTMAGEYERAGRLASAALQFDAWIAAHPDDSRLPGALAGRCWAEALDGAVLDKAAADCDAARRAVQATARAYEGRGLVRLRRGDNAGAIADFNTALQRQPKAAWALYGRGLAEQRLGKKAEGDADAAAAVLIQPDLPDLAKRHGIVAEAAPPAPSSPAAAH